MQVPFYLVDAFADAPFKGNPAAVCLLPHWLPDETLRQIAIETNQAETAFAVKHETGYELRWFTPTFEIDLCGHATLATAHVLFKHAGYAAELLHFTTRFVGPLAVKNMGDWLELDFPARPPSCLSAIPPGVVAALGGATPLESWANERDYMLVFASAAEIKAIQPNFTLLAQLEKWACITAPGDAGIDFVSRFFTPGDGRNEDPVTGSAHAMLTPYWAARLGRTELQARQLSDRGGMLKCRVSGDRILIAGQACTTVEGTLFLPN